MALAPVALHSPAIREIRAEEHRHNTARAGRGMSKCVLSAGLLVVAFCQGVVAQEGQPGDASLKTAGVVRTATPPVIDGRLDEDVWSLAGVVEDLHQTQPTEFAAPSERTEIRLLYDEDALYVGVRLWDSEADGIVARVLRQGELVLGDDHFGVILDPFNNRRSGYMFIVSPNSVRVDGLYRNANQLQLDWDGIYNASATQDDQGWVAEMAIPFKTLSFDPNNDTWGINFMRVIGRKNERLAWVSRNRSLNPSIAGLAAGFAGLEQGPGVDIVPSVSVHRKTSSLDRSHNVEPSLDVFYKPSPSLSASLTMNTDFSSTEVDDRQVNLTRFGLFFPEKRDFFLRDLDIFEFGGQGGFGGGSNVAASGASRQNGRPFFSRRIGLSASGEPVDLDYGGKLSGRIGRWSVGALAVRQDGSGGVNATNLFVGRVTANVLSESKVGLIATRGDSRSNVGNALVGADFQYLNTRFRGSQVVQAEAWYMQTQTEGLEGEDSAFGLGFRMPNSSGLRWGGAVKELQSHFNPELGFVSRGGVRDQTLEFGYTIRPRNDYVRSIYAGVDAQRITRLAGGLQSQVIAVRLFEMEHGARDRIGLHLIAEREALVRPFEISPGVIIPEGEYSFNEYRLDVGSGPERRLSGGFTYLVGDFYDGARVGLAGRLTWRPFKHFRSGIGYRYDDVNLPQGDFTTRLMSVRTDVVFSSRLSWVNLVQYDNVSESVGMNSRLHWVPEAGKDLFLVLNQNFVEDLDGTFRSTSTNITLKANYTLRF